MTKTDINSKKLSKKQNPPPPKKILYDKPFITIYNVCKITIC